MIVTEKEAAEKWCPYGKFYPPGEHKYPGGGMQWGAVDMPSAQQRCIGSRCMAWRWGVEHKYDLMWREQSEKGYCAAFGKVDP